MSATHSVSSNSSQSRESSGRRSPSMIQTRFRQPRPRSSPPENDEPRRRALSEAIPSLGHGRWRIVGAWSSLRKGNTTDDSSEQKEKDKDSDKDHDHSEKQTTMRRRKRVSLFLRRRRKKVTEDDTKTRQPNVSFESTVSIDHLKNEDETQGEDDHDDDVEDDDSGDLRRRHFQRAQSHIIKPVGAVTAHGHGEGARYLNYAADIDDDSFDRLKELALKGRSRNTVALVVDKHESRNDNGNTNDNDTPKDETHEGEEEFIGEICLEDFADGDEEFDFLDNQSVDFGFEPSSGGRMSRRPSLKLDSNKVRWIGNEKEFAAFFADIGLDDWFDVEAETVWTEFEVDEIVANEWREASIEHNQRCTGWKQLSTNVDIRDLIGDFSRVHDL